MTEPSGISEIASADVAWIDAAEMVEVDRVMIEDLHIELIQMMENAGARLARLVLDLIAPSTVVVAAGSGGNGGGGLVAARHFANAGVDVSVATTRPRAEMAAVPAHQLDIVERIGVPSATSFDGADAIVDAVIGYSLRGAPRGESLRLIEAMNASSARVVSLDVPSGLDATSGSAPGAVVTAAATVTLALPKIGLRDADEVGDLYLADISVPRSVTESFGPPAPAFGPAGLARIT